MAEIKLADIHTHILPAVDDGAADLQTSLEMLRMEAEQGVKLLFLTPHYMHGRGRYEGPELKRRFAELMQNEEAAKIRASGMDIRLGSELHYTAELVSELDSGIALTMDGTKTILLEFYPGDSARKIADGCRDVYNGGYRVILAHIERYINLDEALLNQLLDMDVRFQMNASYVKDLFRLQLGRKRWHKKLLKEGIVSFIATDTHNTTTRRPDLSADFMIRNLPERAEELLWLNAAQITGKGEK